MGNYKKLLVLAIGGTMLLHPLAIAPGVVYADGEATAQQATAMIDTTPKLVATSENRITAGAIRRDYQWITTAKDGTQSIANVHVIEIDLTNPYVSLNAMNPNGGTLPSKSSVTSMVKNTGAVAGVNADYFDTQSEEQVPFGAQITNGALVKSPRQLSGMFMFGLTAERVPVVDRFTFEGTVVAADGTAIPLSGMNEAAYSAAESNIAYSHANALYLYTSAWTAAERPNRLASATTPTEVLVQGGIVTQVADNATLPIQVPADGYILRGHGTAAKLLLEHYPIGTSVSADMKLRSVTSQKTFDPSSFQMMVGGHTILVNDGQPSSFSRSVNSISPSSDRARTAVGYSQDMKKVYLITAEDHGASVGVTLAELQKIMVQLGVWKGVNLDGGGSTTMADRPLGEFDVKLSHPTESSGGTYQRPVVNGIGVYTSAPQGALKGIKASGKSVLFIGEQTEYKLTAYDTYYNPLDPSGIAPSWSLDKPELAALSGGILTAARPGEATLTVKAGDGTDKLALEVIGESRIDKLSIEAPAAELRAGAELSAKVQATLADGRTFTVPAGSIDWEFRGFLGSVQGDKIRVDAVKEGAAVGYAIARYDGYSAMVTLAVGSTQRAFQDFENVTYAIGAKSDPVEVGAGVQLVSGLDGNASKALKLNYNFSLSTEERTKAAYAVFKGGTGITLPGEPIGMSVDVYGDSGRNWLRATIVDAAGTSHKVDLAKAVDWSGWQTVKVDFAGLPIAYPAKLQEIYVATVKEGQDERAMAGELAVDNIVLHDAPKLAAAGTKIVLTLDKKSAIVSGEKAALDVAPIALDGVTYLPFRFVADAMGGQVAWDNARKQVTALRGDKLLEMWLGKETLIVNGERKPAGTVPIVRGGRTLVPVRLVSEQLGLQVDWDAKTKTITIQ